MTFGLNAVLRTCVPKLWTDEKLGATSMFASCSNWSLRQDTLAGYPRVWCLRGLYPNLSRINFLGPSFFQNKCPFPKKGTTPRRTWYKKKIQNQFWDHGGKYFWIKFQWPRSCLSFSYEVDVGVENTLLRNKQPSAILLRFLVETKTCFGGRFDFTPSRAETPTAG